jgi:hypothetical protein
LGTYSLEAAGDQALLMLDLLQALGYQFFLENDLNHPVETIEALLAHVPSDATINILCHREA